MIDGRADQKVFADSQLFEEVVRPLLQQGLSIRFQARGGSMSPAIRDQEIVKVTPVIVTKLRKDDIVLAKSNAGFRLHRVVEADPARDIFITRGDCGQQDDPALKGSQILGLAQSKEVRLGKKIVQASFRSTGGWLLRSAARVQYLVAKLAERTRFSRAIRKTSGTWLCIVGLLSVLSAAAAKAQVVVDTTSSNSGTLNGTNAALGAFAHTTTTATTNRLLLVGVSINITNGPTAGVVSVTYNGMGLTFAGAHNDAARTRRVEMWYMLAPPTGTFNVVVRVNTTGVNEGVVAGATTFTGVDQTSPLGTFVSADGANGGNSQLDVPSVINGLILDTLAVDGTQTVTIPGPQVQQWNVQRGNNTNPGVVGVGTTRSGAPSVPISETFSGTSNWSLGAISINPTSADIAVSTSVSAVALGQNSTYNITVSNNGPSPANSVVLTDTLAPGLALISVSPSTGTSCSGTGPITCNLPASLASGASATVAVVVNATVAGFYPNTATITDSGTPPDPNTGNNTYVAVAPVVSVVCASGVPPNGGTLTGVQNTYFPGTASVAAGATSIPIGTANGSGTIQAGSELLVIQMQDASINTSNSVAYGNGSTGAGFTSINNAGNYEFVTAIGPVSGGSVPILGAGSGGGLVFGYNETAASATAGQSTYQVVLVPQYTTATLSSSVTALPWNGSTGGILALDIASTLTLGTATVSVDGLGFRGGAGLQLQGGGGANTDYVQPAPATYTGVAEAGWDAAKGEGVAGTPAWVESAGTYLASGTNYPSGTAGVDGSMAHGAPANGGGGATDGHPNGANPGGNDQNAGGGGGANGGTGGYGGDSWNTNLSSGGEGGAPFPATIDRLSMGGGGGAGTRNNSDGDTQASSGSAGGGIIFIRAYAFSGTATLTENGDSAYNGTANDSGGGGGAGGTIVILAANGGEGGLTLRANGGRGGDAWDSQAYSLGNRHGPGGGGGGGVIFVSAAPSSMTVTGGADGTTLTPGVAYGATSGTAGSTSTTANLSQVTGLQSTEVCTRLPDLTINKSHVGTNFTRGSPAAYTLVVSSLSTSGASTSGLVTVNDTLPTGITPTTATGTGWTCSVSNQTVSCTRSDALAIGASYPSITVNVNVSQSAAATLTNTARVSGGGDVSPLNDTSTDTVSVVSSADMAVTDAGSPNPVSTNGTITYTVVVTNNGPSAADNATLAMPLPNATTFVSLTPPAGWSCLTGGGGNSVCTNANLPGLGSATFTFVVKVANGVTNGTVITGSATVSSSVVDTVPANNAATVTTIVGTSAPNLSVTNVASPNPVQAGGTITYTQVVTNTGSTAVTNGTFTEATPANTTFGLIVSQPAGWICTGFPASPCTATSVAAGSSGTFVIRYQVNAGTAAGTVISDTATVNGSNQSFGPSSATATDVVATATQADVALSTVAAPGTVYAGNDITYTQTVSNNGPAAATGVAFTEATPTNTTFQSVLAPAGWTCTSPVVGATGTVNCTDNSTLSSGSSADIVVVVNVPSTVAIGTITATSSVSATTSDPNSANNTTTVMNAVNVICDLSVTNSGTPSPVTAGNNITYTQVITNSGPSSCSTGALNEATPNNSAFVSVAVVNSGGAAWSCPNTAPVACNASSVPPGSSGTVTAIYRVNTGTAGGTIITDTVNVTTTTRDTNSANNSATVSIPVASATQADLSVTNVGSPNPVTAGNNITYTQSVTNAGQATATAPVLTETLPAGTTAVSLSGAGWNCSLVTLKCTDTTNMAANTTANFTFVVTVPSTVASGTILAQTASVSSTTTDPNLGNNSVTVNTLVAGAADLSVTNSPSPVPVQANNTITYTQVVTNGGPSTATGVNLTETVPAQTTAQTLTGPAGWACNVGTLTCSNPSFATGSATITYTVLVNNGTAPGTAINETATVSSSVTDPNQSNNTATAADVVASATQADLVVTNSASPTSVIAGSNVTYTQSVTNKGPATANGASFTQTTPPNTNFQSITAPAGWSCGTSPAVGGTGTITCSATGALAVNSSGTFTLVLQVNSGTPSGTNITDTATATATNIVPSLTTNTASATVVVANANSADLAIVKTATPNPVTEGTPLTYSLVVTNNGPASATNVMVTDTLPSTVIYLSSTTAAPGTCSEAGGTVTCLLGTMVNGATATITILTIPGQPGLISNTATVGTPDQTDPNTSNNSSTQSEIVVAPTRITLRSFSAHYGSDKNGANRVVLIWKTGGESHNLGFNVYREVNGNSVRVNPSIIAGSALMMSGSLARHAAKSYAWIDTSTPVMGATYWLEDIDVNGSRTMHGPVSAAGAQTSAEATPSQSRMLSQVNQAQPPVPGSQDSDILEAFADSSSLTRSQLQKQFELASHPAIKINIRHEGWYRVGQPDLVKAGLDPNVDPATLRLYSEAIEQSIQITGAAPGPGGFGPGAAINFYGIGINTVFSGTRVYWLASSDGHGARIPRRGASAGSNQPPPSYPTTAQLQQHTLYFSALITSDDENFFGALVSSTPVDQVLHVPHLDMTSSETSKLELSLQGVIGGYPHDVVVALNGTNLGDMAFTGQDKGRMSFDLPTGVLKPWNNTVTLTAQNGDYDTSLVDYIRITYPHRYVADDDQLKFSGRAGEEITATSFSSSPLVLDITDPNRPVQLTPHVTSQEGKYEIAVQVPFTTTNPLAPERHTLLAVANTRVSSPAGISPNHPSRWHSPQPGADIAMVSYGGFAGTLSPLVRAHHAEGKSAAVVPVGELYDEFTFGEHSPFAIRRFLESAVKNWTKPPTYLLLNGRASLDPRNYLGFGDLDLVPTRIVPSASLMTASDDWFSDFDDTGTPTVATGRLPVSTIAEAQTVARKISTYEGKSTSGPWTSNALFVADRDDVESFTQDSQAVQSKLPSTMQPTDIFVDNVGVVAARASITNAINSGQVLVNYLGHGSEEQWAGPDIFDGDTVNSLTNDSQLPVFLIMDCLNGFFQDVYAQPLGVSLILAPNGGAVGVLASSGLNQAPPQTNLDVLVVQNAFGGNAITLGEAIVKAKSNIADIDVRRTFVLFGDPAMKIRQPASSTAVH